jgi:outer membrane protease
MYTKLRSKILKGDNTWEYNTNVKIKIKGTEVMAGYMGLMAISWDSNHKPSDFTKAVNFLTI